MAVAHRRALPWASGVHAMELWGLLMAVQSFDPCCSLKVDCWAVHLGSKRGRACATAPGRTFARAWGPPSVSLEDDPERAVWMSARSTATSYIGKRLSNGQPALAHDVVGDTLCTGWPSRSLAKMRCPGPRSR